MGDPLIDGIFSMEGNRSPERKWRVEEVEEGHFPYYSPFFFFGRPAFLGNRLLPSFFSSNCMKLTLPRGLPVVVTFLIDFSISLSSFLKFLLTEHEVLAWKLKNCCINCAKHFNRLAQFFACNPLLSMIGSNHNRLTSHRKGANQHVYTKS